MVKHELDDFPYEYTTKSTDDFKTYNSVKEQDLRDIDTYHDYHNMNEAEMYGETDNSLKTASSNDLAYSDHPNKNQKDAKTSNRYNRFFVGEQGNVWILWDITEMPNRPYVESEMWSIGEFMPASDGSTLFVTAELYFTRSAALAAFQGKMSMLVHFDDTLTALIELQKM